MTKRKGKKPTKPKAPKKVKGKITFKPITGEATEASVEVAQGATNAEAVRAAGLPVDKVDMVDAKGNALDPAAPFKARSRISASERAQGG